MRWQILLFITFCWKAICPVKRHYFKGNLFIISDLKLLLLNWNSNQIYLNYLSYFFFLLFFPFFYYFHFLSIRCISLYLLFLLSLYLFILYFSLSVYSSLFWSYFSFSYFSYFFSVLLFFSFDKQFQTLNTSYQKQVCSVARL